MSGVDPIATDVVMGAGIYTPAAGEPIHWIEHLAVEDPAAHGWCRRAPDGPYLRAGAHPMAHG